MLPRNKPASLHRPSSLLLPRPSDAELVARAHDHAVLQHDLDHLLAVHLAALLVGEGEQDLLRLRVDDLAGGGIGVAAVEAERHPAGLLADLYARGLLGRHDGGVEDVQVTVGSVTDPDFLFVGSKSDAM